MTPGAAELNADHATLQTNRPDHTDPIAVGARAPECPRALVAEGSRPLRPERDWELPSLSQLRLRALGPVQPTLSRDGDHTFTGTNDDYDSDYDGDYDGDFDDDYDGDFDDSAEPTRLLSLSDIEPRVASPLSAAPISTPGSDFPDPAGPIPAPALPSPAIAAPSWHASLVLGSMMLGFVTFSILGGLLASL
ncbi:MAG: hypothetical protein Tsb0020_45940 [Haliangiales bacterium]